MSSRLTPFVGRQRELADLARLLGDPACRLLTLVGPGGIGKTRLAIEVMDRAADRFEEAVYVPLLLAHSGESLVAAIVDALGFSPTGRQALATQLAGYMRARELLLVLDNLEHLLEGATLLSDLLRAAPRIKLLVTSREALRLQEEWTYPLEGLAYPQEGQAIPQQGPVYSLPAGPASAPESVSPAPAEYEAVRLFLECARRARPEFSLAGSEAGVTRICQLVEGTPLAIELAAAWVRVLDCDAIAAEIEGQMAGSGIDVLSTTVRNVPERHRSLHAVFDQTWARLEEEERAVLARLSVFRGSFCREAAEQVAGATLPVLLALVVKSLLRRRPDGRYQIHELLRQYAERRLASSGEAWAHVTNRHGVYYIELLHDRFDDLMGARQREAALELEAERENLRAAWGWALDRRSVTGIDRAGQALNLFYQSYSRYLEGARALEGATEVLRAAGPSPVRDRALLKTLLDWAWFAIRLGWPEQAEVLTAECRELQRSLGEPNVPGQGTDPALLDATLAHVRGEYAAAVRYGQEALETSEAEGHLWNRQLAGYVLARALWAQGQYGRARQHAWDAYTTTEETGDRWFRAYCLNELGDAAQALHDYQAAEGYYRASYDLRDEFQDPEGTGTALNRLGTVALRRQAYHEAWVLYRRSLAIYETLNDRGGLATATNGLGSAALALGEIHEARQCFQQALQTAMEIPFIPLLFEALIGAGELLLRAGRVEPGLRALSLAASHPSSRHATQQLARQVLERVRSDLTPEQWAELAAHVPGDVLAAARSTLAELPLIDLRAPPPSPEASVDAPSLAQPLIEPLTARELEVLGLIAAGRTNRQIADELVLSAGTVKWYAAQIYGKLGVRSRTQAVARARELGMLH